MFETSENHVKDVYSHYEQAESGELSQFQPISSNAARRKTLGYH